MLKDLWMRIRESVRRIAAMLRIVSKECFSQRSLFLVSCSMPNVIQGKMRPSGEHVVVFETPTLSCVYQVGTAVVRRYFDEMTYMRFAGRGEAPPVIPVRRKEGERHE